MGYATTLYAVDLAALQAAVGSNDPDLLNRARRAAAAHRGAPGPDPARGPRLKITTAGTLLLNGQAVTLEELGSALRQPRWRGTNLYLFRERGRPSRPGPTAVEISQAAGPGTVAGILTCTTEAEFLAGWQDDTLPEDQAVEELITGDFTRPEGDSQYGYALEWLCLALGTRLGTFAGKGRLRALALDTPLAEPRPPVRLPAWDDFPHLGHLTTAEVAAEVRRLEGLDLAYPKNAAIARDRQAFLEHLRSAARLGQGMVAFYY